MTSAKGNMTHYVLHILLANALICTGFIPVFAGTGTPDMETPVTAETAPDGTQRLDIIMDSYSFTPAHIIVAAGKPVEFNLKNVSTLAPHNLTINAPEDGLYVDRDVEAGETATISFLPVKTGKYEFYCSKKLPFLPGHREKGMIGELIVQ